MDDLLYSTLLGSYNKQDFGEEIEFGQDGTVFLVGTTYAADFPDHTRCLRPGLPGSG
jgi:hypothetical protein